MIDQLVLTLKPATSLWDFNENRKIRNECRFFLTNDTNYIGFFQELLFWIKNFRRDNINLYLGYNEDNIAIAYGLIRYKKSPNAWISGGIRETYRGLGYGRLLFTSLCAESHQLVSLEVLASNVLAFNLYCSLGFKEVKRFSRGSREIVHMERTPSPSPSTVAGPS